MLSAIEERVQEVHEDVLVLLSGLFLSSKSTQRLLPARLLGDTFFLPSVSVYLPDQIFHSPEQQALLILPQNSHGISPTASCLTGFTGYSDESQPSRVVGFA